MRHDLRFYDVLQEHKREAEGSAGEGEDGLVELVYGLDFVFPQTVEICLVEVSILLGRCPLCHFRRRLVTFGILRSQIFHNLLTAMFDTRPAMLI